MMEQKKQSIIKVQDSIRTINRKKELRLKTLEDNKKILSFF